LHFLLKKFARKALFDCGIKIRHIKRSDKRKSRNFNRYSFLTLILLIRINKYFRPEIRNMITSRTDEIFTTREIVLTLKGKPLRHYIIYISKIFRYTCYLCVL